MVWKAANGRMVWLPAVVTLTLAGVGGIFAWVRNNSADITAVTKENAELRERLARLEVLEADDRRAIARCALKALAEP